jgi:hypothetical protein
MKLLLRHLSRPLLAITFVIAPTLSAQQVSDTSFRPPIANPSFAAGRGPLVLLDEQHSNFHTVEGRYKPFVMLLERDGFVVRPNRAPFTRDALAQARVLVIANALNKRNERDWNLPNPSAFTDAEIAEVREWVRAGGSLLLIADHMPMAGAAEQLALEFGAIYGNGFAADSNMSTGAMRFRRSEKFLGAHPVTDGRAPSERIDSLTTFTGSAFRLIGPGTPLITLGKSTLLMPKQAWVFGDTVARVRADGMLQGAAIEFGQGRVILLAEAAMLSAQVAGPQRNRMGMNHPQAPQNAQFVLNVLRWLGRVY